MKRKYTEISPNKFWNIIFLSSSHWRFILLVLISIAFILGLLPLTYPKIEAESNLDILLAKFSILVHPLAIWGIWLAAKALAAFRVEEAVAEYVEMKAVEELRKAKSHEKEHMGLSQLEHEVLPYNRDSSIVRLFQKILREADDRNFESSFHAMQLHREETIGYISELQTISRIALQLGILGALIGLIGTLPDLTSGNENILNFSTFWNSSRISFSTIVAGLEVSIILNLLIIIVRKKQDSYFQKMESATVNFMSLARNVIDYEAPIEQLYKMLPRVAYDLSNILSDRFRKTSDEFNNCLSQSIERLEEFNKTFEYSREFNDCLSQSTERLEEFNKAFEYSRQLLITNKAERVLVRIKINQQLEHFDEEKLKKLISTIATQLVVTKEDIELVYIIPGSVIVTLQMSEEAALKLMSLYLNHDPIMHELNVEKVELSPILSFSSQIPSKINISSAQPEQTNTRILFLTANPSDTARLKTDEELKRIQTNLKLAKERESFKFEQEVAATIDTLMQAVLDKSPNIIHFSGHGQQEGITLQDESGRSKIIPAEALASLFELFKDKVKCVVINSCYSKSQAEAIKMHIPYVIGMKSGIPDSAAIAFSVGFYKAIGAGKDIPFAFQFGVAAIQLEGVSGNDVPVLM